MGEKLKCYLSNFRPIMGCQCSQEDIPKESDSVPTLITDDRISTMRLSPWSIAISAFSEDSCNIDPDNRGSGDTLDVRCTWRDRDMKSFQTFHTADLPPGKKKISVEL